MAEVAFELAESQKGVFRPNATTKELIAGTARSISTPGRLLDLGCGSGVVGISLFKSGKLSGPLCGSDLSAEAVDALVSNCRGLGIAVDARVGSIFEPWAGETFDYIVDDVSGIAEDVAKISPWFPPGVPCETGSDGTRLVLEAIARAPEHLVPGGAFFFPVLSLSNAGRILECARSTFGELECLSTISWPMPPEMLAHGEQLRELRASGAIQFEEKFGYFIASTSFYVGRP